MLRSTTGQVALVVLLALLGAGAAAVVQLVAAPPYTSRATFFLAQAPRANVELASSSGVVELKGRSYASLVEGPQVGQLVAESLPQGSADFDLSANYSSGTVIIDVESTSRSAETASASLEALMRRLPRQVAQLESSQAGTEASPLVLREADPPTEPRREPRPAVLVVAGGLGGAALGLVVLLVRLRRQQPAPAPAPAPTPAET